MADKPRYEPTRFMLESSHYDKKRADRAVAFIQSLRHTKGVWAGQPFNLMTWQEQVIRDLFGTINDKGYRQFNTSFVEIGKKQGKQLALDTPIPTPTGWSTMGELAVGDKVFDETGHECRVVAKSEIDDTEQAYKLTFRDGSTIVAGARHLWDCEYIYGKHKRCVVQTEEIYEKTQHCLNETQRHNASVIRIKVAAPIQTVCASLPVVPYLYGHQLRKASCDKAIRREYLRASEAQRWELLQGLMDSDGAIGEIKAQSVYVSTIKQLAEDVRELLWSLGIKNAMTETPSTRYGVPTGETLYQVRFTTFDDQPTSKLERKIERKRERIKKTRSCYHYLRSIEKLEAPVKMQCIQVDSSSHCYLAGRSMVPTHNSELAAAVALYMLCADGEEAAEVYGCANDKNQAAIVFNVASDMVKYSPQLAQRIKIVDSTKRLVYMPTRSIYQVLSSDVASKYGYNVSCCVFDELLGQPNRKLYDVMTKGAGAARKQPLNFVITTAGSDKTSICYEVHSKAKDILEGRKKDETFYPVIYGADEADDWTSPETWAKANPSMGRTVDVDFYRKACQSAIDNPAEEIHFRQFHLNQWTNTSVRWMPMDKWDACGIDITLDELEGRECYAGLDLSSTSDLTALVLCFPPAEESDRYIIVPFFWLPEDTLPMRVRRDHVMYDVWHKQGYINTTEGNVVHYAYIEEFIMELYKRVNIKEIAYDRWNASMLVQNLQGDGLTMIPFGQGYRDMSQPTKDIMRMVLSGELAHNKSPVLRWNFDNVYVQTDPAGNLKMSKEKSTEKIDGAVATVMALDRAQRHTNSGDSVYNHRGLFVL